MWLNGHEWAKCQLDHAGINYVALANGFESCDDADALAAVCASFGPDDVQGFFDRWIDQIPVPFTPKDRGAGYWWELSMRQVEVSRTLVLDDPRRARRFFEALVADNIGIGRPEEVHVVFGRGRRGRVTSKQFRTRVFGPGTDVKMDFAYKHSRVKQYLKEGRAFRIETVINKPSDIGVLARLEHLPELITKAREVNAVYSQQSVPASAVPLETISSTVSTSLTTERANEPEPCASGTHAPWHWPVRSAVSSTPSPASRTRAFAGLSPDSSAPTTPPAR